MNPKQLHKQQKPFVIKLWSYPMWLLLLVWVLAACTPTASPDPRPMATLPYTPPATQVAATQLAEKPTPTVYPQELALPQTLRELAEWVGQQRQHGTAAYDVQQTLSANSWLADWRELDLTGDGQVEWIIVLKQETGSVFGPEGDVIVVTPAGLAYRHYAKFVNDGDALPTLEYFGDMTGDGLPELVILTLFCGAHTCSHAYDIVGAPSGSVESLVAAVTEYPHSAINMMSSTAVFEDRTGDGRIDLVQHGGFIGSAGAGPYQRGYTEIWAWQPTQNQFALAGTIHDPSNYRFHLLYEANDLFVVGDYAAAIPKYIDVVEDPNLEDGVGLVIPESTYDPSRQFAAFRLMIAYLQLGDMDNSIVWSGWLYNNYPNAAITEGVIAFWEDYNFNHSVAWAVPPRGACWRPFPIQLVPWPIWVMPCLA